MSKSLRTLARGTGVAWRVAGAVLTAGHAGQRLRLPPTVRGEVLGRVRMEAKLGRPQVCHVRLMQGAP